MVCLRTRGESNLSALNEPFVWTVFALVYLGMLLGRLPGLALDRTGVALLGTGVALLGAIALVAGGLLLTSRRTASRANLALVDWQLLLLFIGLFVVHRAVESTGAVIFFPKSSNKTKKTF